IKKLHLTSPNRNQPLEQHKQQCGMKKQIVKNKIKRFEMYVDMSKAIKQSWLDLIQQTTTITKKKEEEGRYENMIDDKQVSCLKGEALEAVRGFDITPENYELIRQILTDKFRKSASIKTLFYNEFHSVKRNDKEWKLIFEAMERTLRQLEAIDLCHRTNFAIWHLHSTSSPPKLILNNRRLQYEKQVLRRYNEIGKEQTQCNIIEVTLDMSHEVGITTYMVKTMENNCTSIKIDKDHNKGEIQLQGNVNLANHRRSDYPRPHPYNNPRNCLDPKKLGA
ncbi:unnamed protein product, partial [Acanthocheilonema viteae]